MRLRQQKYLNNIVEQDHRIIKKRIRSMLESFDTATSILSGVEAMHMIKKEQITLWNQSVQNQKEFIHQLFGLAIKDTIPLGIYVLYSLLFNVCTRTVLGIFGVELHIIVVKGPISHVTLDDLREST
ncbi:hypothetical protein BAPA111461_27085 [Bacillus paramycoides]